MHIYLYIYYPYPRARLLYLGFSAAHFRHHGAKNFTITGVSPAYEAKGGGENGKISKYKMGT